MGSNGGPISEFCRYCGAGVGEFRRTGEGTCPKCDPNVRIICIDGPRKGREYFFPKGTLQLNVRTIVPVHGARPGDYGYGSWADLTYKVYGMWGTGILVGMLQSTRYV